MVFTENQNTVIMRAEKQERDDYGEQTGYRAVYEGGQGEIVEKKSRFIATVLPIETEEEAIGVYCEDEKEILGCKTQLLCLCHWRAVRSYKDVPMTENQTVPPVVQC